MSSRSTILLLKESSNNSGGKNSSKVPIDRVKLDKDVATKLFESELFLVAADNNLRKVEAIKKHLTLNDKKRIMAANLEVGYDTESLEDKMDFINWLPYASKLQMIEPLLDKLAFREEGEDQNEADES